MIQSTAQELTASDNTAVKSTSWTIISFLRLLSILFLYLTLETWLGLIGYWPEERFDVIATPQKVYGAIQAVLLPVASVSLWTTLSWGRAIWFIAAVVQLTAYMAFPESLSVNIIALAVLLISVPIYFIMRYALYLIAKNE